MKRLLTWLVLLCLILSAFPAMASGEYIGDMEVINCNEWVSLRKRPSTSSSQLVKVSLGAIVANCQTIDAEWIYAEYDGYSGYILAKYLQPSQGRLTFNAMMITLTGDGAPFYATIDSTEPVDFIPPNTIVRNCCLVANNRLYVEWGSRCGFVELLHAEVYNEMLHYPRKITLHNSLYGQTYETPSPALQITGLSDFPIKGYDCSVFQYDDYLEADAEDLPKVEFVLHSQTMISKVHLFSVEMLSWDSDAGDAVYEATLEDIQQQLTPEHPLCVGAVIWGDAPNLAVGYEDEQGAYHFVFVEISGEDGRLMLREF